MINGSLLPAGSRYEIRLGKEAQKVGYNIYLSEDCEIQGYHVRNKAGIDACIVGFYQNGSMRNFASYEDIEINSIPVRGGKNYCISLYPNGRIWMGYLSRNIEIDGQSFTEGHRVLCDTTGKVFEYSLNLQIKIMKELNIY